MTMDYREKYEELKNRIQKAVSEIQESGRIAYEAGQNESLYYDSRSYMQGKASGMFISEAIVEELLQEDNE